MRDISWLDLAVPSPQYAAHTRYNCNGATRILGYNVPRNVQEIWGSIPEAVRHHASGVSSQVSK